MNLIQPNRSLVQLRLSGMAAVLETRLLQAQAEAMAPIDLISILVSDELACRSKRLLDRRHKQAKFRDANKQLDNFDFQFNPKMNRSLVFDLATAGWIGRREDALFLGPSSIEGITQSVDECQALNTSRSSSRAAAQIRGDPTEKLAQSGLKTQAGREQIVLSGSSQKMCSPLRSLIRRNTRNDWP